MKPQANPTIDTFELTGSVSEHPLVKRARERAETFAHEVEGIRLYPAVKQSMDIVGATSLLIATAPLMFFSAIAVRLSSPGPIILKQRRLTEGGREFTLLKFRTMRADAEKLSGPVFAGEDDPRVTRIGKFMRKTRLDELPQLINVLRGEMSLIGPRPERPEIAAELKESIARFDKRLGVKAGLTGLAQVVQGYPDGIDGYRKKLAWDVVYISKRSLKLDLWIALRTVGVILSGSGAR